MPLWNKEYFELTINKTHQIKRPFVFLLFAVKQKSKSPLRNVSQTKKDRENKSKFPKLIKKNPTLIVHNFPPQTYFLTVYGL